MSERVKDPLLLEIEIQLKLAQQALNNVVGFVSRLNAGPSDAEPNDVDRDTPFPTYDETTVPPFPTTGGRNGRKKEHR